MWTIVSEMGLRSVTVWHSAVTYGNHTMPGSVQTVVSDAEWSLDIPRPDSRFAPGQWETPLQSNGVSHWLGANLESALIPSGTTSQGGMSTEDTDNQRIITRRDWNGSVCGQVRMHCLSLARGILFCILYTGYKMVIFENIVWRIAKPYMVWLWNAP